MPSTVSPSAEDTRAPSWPLWVAELRAWPMLAGYLASVPSWRHAPRGDGHPVWVLPGLAQSDVSTRPLRWFLRQRGHAASPWRLGVNTGRPGIVDEHLLPRLLEQHERSGTRISLIGWSMGGLFARELALRAPQAVRQVVTLGSPFTGAAKASNAWRLYELLSGRRAGDPAVRERYAGPLAVPSTAIYSRLDGIVAWHTSLQDLDAATAPAENIEVRSAHLAFGHHPAVLAAVADRLAQPEGQWRPFVAPAPLRRLFYPASASNTEPRQETHDEPRQTARPQGPHRARDRRVARPRPADGRSAG
jgi:pimeloyl-ACP methyl ester carboxylesterase